MWATIFIIGQLGATTYARDTMILSCNRWEPQVIRIINRDNKIIYSYCPTEDADLSLCSPLVKEEGFERESLAKGAKTNGIKERAHKYAIPVISLMAIIGTFHAVTRAVKTAGTAFFIGLGLSPFLLLEANEDLYADLAESLSVEDLEGYNLCVGSEAYPISDFVEELEKELYKIEHCHLTRRGTRCF